MATRKILISGGDVIEVQLTSETVLIGSFDGRQMHAEPGHIINRMRLFVRKTDGKEQKFDFEETNLGVRETQRVAIVRGRTKKKPDPFNLVLYNLSSGEREVFESNLNEYLARTPFFGPMTQAAGWSLAVALVFWLYSNFIERGGEGGLGSIAFAIFFGFLTYPVFWFLCRTWQRVSAKSRLAAARRRFLKDMDARVQRYATSPSAAPQPRPAPQPVAPAAPAPVPEIAPAAVAPIAPIAPIAPAIAAAAETEEGAPYEPPSEAPFSAAEAEPPAAPVEEGETYDPDAPPPAGPQEARDT
jgi:hypothetical protein